MVVLLIEVGVDPLLDFKLESLVIIELSKADDIFVLDMVVLTSELATLSVISTSVLSVTVGVSNPTSNFVEDTAAIERAQKRLDSFNL